MSTSETQVGTVHDFTALNGRNGDQLAAELLRRREARAANQSSKAALFSRDLRVVLFHMAEESLGLRNRRGNDLDEVDLDNLRNGDTVDCELSALILSIRRGLTLAGYLALTGTATAWLNAFCTENHAEASRTEAAQQVAEGGGPLEECSPGGAAEETSSDIDTTPAGIFETGVPELEYRSLDEIPLLNAHERWLQYDWFTAQDRVWGYGCRASAVVIPVAPHEVEIVRNIAQHVLWNDPRDPGCHDEVRTRYVRSTGELWVWTASNFSNCGVPIPVSID